MIVPVTINVARSQDEALRQAKGEDVLAERDDDDDLEFDDDDETPAADAPAEVPGLGDQPDI